MTFLPVLFGVFLLLSVLLMLWFSPSPKSRFFLSEKATVYISYSNYFATLTFIFTVLFSLSVLYNILAPSK
jgi:hypothetical protein